ncbi:MAG TPA: hypothetical protein VG842_11300 [Sediminibacterium sp.]|nr:hypothetical protein [Sediminibacterium sp.]
MSPTKIVLSKEEQELLLNPDWILTKNALIAKVYTLFGSLSEVYRTILPAGHPLFQEETAVLAPKIAKGEQYKGLPWVMLDYPRQFGRTDMLAIRSFFWWGRYASISLLLQGGFRSQWEASVTKYLLAAKQSPDADGAWLITDGEQPWEQDITAAGQVSLQQWNGHFAADKAILKIIAVWPLSQWETLPDFFERKFRELADMLQEGSGAQAVK